MLERVHYIWCGYSIWRELCVYLCNHVIQRSWFHVTLVKIRQWGRAGSVRLTLYLHRIPTVRRNWTPWRICVDRFKKRKNICKGCQHLLHLKYRNRIYILTPTSPSTISFESRCLKIIIKNSIYGRHTSSAAVEINFKWVCFPRESTAIAQIQQY